MSKRLVTVVVESLVSTTRIVVEQDSEGRLIVRRLRGGSEAPETHIIAVRTMTSALVTVEIPRNPREDLPTGQRRAGVPRRRSATRRR